MSTHNPDTYGALLELLQQLTPEQLKFPVVVTLDPNSDLGTVSAEAEVPSTVGVLLVQGITVEL